MTKRSVLAWLVASTGLVVVALSATPEARERAARRPIVHKAYVVAAVGDSLTDYRSGGGEFLRYLERRCPESRFDNYGRGGKMVNQMRRRFEQDLFGKGRGRTADKPHYTHVIIFGGVNDLYSDLTAGRTPKKISKDLARMYASARERNVRVVAVTVAPWGGFHKYYNARRGAATRRLNRWIRAQLDSGSVNHVIDAYGLLSCGDPERLCPRYAKPYKDGIHFGPEGHEQLGRALYTAVFEDCK